MTKTRPRTELWMCRSCDRQWSGVTQAHCARCHEHFSTANVFDLHWRGRGEERACVAPATILDTDGDPVVRQVQTKYGMTWVRADPRLNLLTLQK